MHWRHILLGGLLFAFIYLIGAPATVHAAELPLPSDPHFENSSNKEGKFYGSVRFKPAADQSNITDYAIYFLDGKGGKLELLGMVNVKKQEEGIAYTRSLGFDFSNGYYSFTLQSEEEIDIPTGTKWIGIYPKNASGESGNRITTFAWETHFFYVQNARFEDTNPELGKIEGTLSWRLAPEAQGVKGFVIRYFDGEHHQELPAPHGRIEAGKGEYALTITPGMLPDMASSFYIQPLIELQSDDHGPGGSTDIVDMISADTEGLQVTTPGVPVPSQVSFKDTDLRSGFIAGTVSWKAEDREFMKSEYSSRMVPFVYSLYFLDANDKKIKGIVSMPRDYYEYGNYDIRLPADLAVPSDARAIGVFLQMPASEGIEFGKVELRDETGQDYYAKDARFLDENPNAGVINGKVSWAPSDNESDLKGYALFAGRESKPFATVPVGAEYSVALPEYVAESGHKTVRIIPMDAQGQYLQSTSFKDARVHIADNMLSETKVGHGILKHAGRMFGSGMLRDEDDRPGYVSAVLTEGARVPEGTMQWYFYDHKGHRLASIGKVDFDITPDRERVTFVIPMGTKIPAGAVYIGVSKPDIDGNIEENGVIINDHATSGSIEFSDLSGNWDFAISHLASLGVVTGYNDLTFRPNETVTRAQFAAMAVRAFRLQTQPYAGTFNDVKETDWHSGAVATAVEAGLLQGYEDGTFRPNQTITRKEMYAIVYRILLWRSEPGILQSYDKKELEQTYADWDQVPEWLFPALSKLKWFDLLPDEEMLDPDREVSREECAAMVYHLMTNMYSLVD